MNLIVQRIKGAIYGFAVGDALGCTTEFLTAEQIRERYGVHQDIVGGGVFEWQKGAVTDDTDMMLCVANACIDPANKTVEKILDSCCANFVSWYKCGPKDVGQTCRDVIRRCMSPKMHKWRYWRKMSKAVQELGGREAYGNGGLMRCLIPAILSVLMFDEREVIDWGQVAVGQSSLTHRNMLCDDAVRIYIMMLRIALFDLSVYEEECRLEELVHEGNSGFIKDTLGCVGDYFKASIFNDVPFEEVLIKAVNDGGDADTIAALTGGLVGFSQGYEAIPKRWLDALLPDVVTALDRVFEAVCSICGLSFNG